MSVPYRVFSILLLLLLLLLSVFKDGKGGVGSRAPLRYVVSSLLRERERRGRGGGRKETIVRGKRQRSGYDTVPRGNEPHFLLTAGDAGAFSLQTGYLPRERNREVGLESILFLSMMNYNFVNRQV